MTRIIVAIAVLVGAPTIVGFRGGLSPGVIAAVVLGLRGAYIAARPFRAGRQAEVDHVRMVAVGAGLVGFRGAFGGRFRSRLWSAFWSRFRGAFWSRFRSAFWSRFWGAFGSDIFSCFLGIGAESKGEQKEKSQNGSCHVCWVV